MSVILFRSPKTPNPKSLPLVPEEFITLLEVTLYKLIGANCFDRDMVGSDFHVKMRVKFQNASIKEKKTKVIKIKTIFC